MWLKKLILFGICSRLTLYMTQILVGSIMKNGKSPTMDDSQLENECDSDTGTINNLPESIKAKILQYLPIKEMVRTCILSKGWRHTWYNVQDLYIDFDNHGSNHHRVMASSYEQDLKRIVFTDQVLKLHNGNVRILRINGVKPGKEYFERWMLKLSNMQIKELILELDCQRSWSQRPCLSDDLCALKLPKDFDGFKQLRSLCLTVDCKISETDLTKLISSCPLLEELTFNGLSYPVLKIHALKLRKMSVSGNIGDLYLQAPNLLEVSIFNTCFKTKATRRVIFGRNLIQALRSVSHIKYLSIYIRCPDPWVQTLPERTPPILDNLTEMFIYFSPCDAEVMTLMLFLFRNAPNLQKLTLVFRSLPSSYIPSAYEQLESSQHQLFSGLRDVKIILNPGSDCAIALAKFILNKAHVLEKMIVWDNIKNLEDSKARELKGLSVRAEIILRKMDDNSKGEINLY